MKKLSTRDQFFSRLLAKSLLELAIGIAVIVSMLAFDPAPSNEPVVCDAYARCE